MKRYFDTGVLVKAYAVEPGTAQALVLIRQVKPPIPFTHLHGIEIRSALRLNADEGNHCIRDADFTTPVPGLHRRRTA